MNSLKNIGFCIAMLLATVGCAQDLPDLLFRHLDSKEGLSDPNLSVIFKDSYGLVWIGSQNGLTRFDGTSCRVYQHNDKDSQSICANYIVNIIEDKNRDLWVGTQNGLARYNRATDNFTNYKKFDSDKPIAPNFYSYPFFIDKENLLWAYLSGIIFKIDTEQRTAKSLTAYSNGRAFVGVPFYQDCNHIITNGVKGIFNVLLKNGKVDSIQRFFMKKNEGEAVVHQAETINDSMSLLCANTGLIKLNAKNGKYEVYDEYEGQKVSANCIAKMPNSDNRYFVGTQQAGLLVFDMEQSAFVKQYAHNSFNPNSIADNQIISITCDNLGNVFLLIPGYGLDYANIYLSQFEHILTKREAIDNNVTAVLALKDKIVAATGSGVYIIDQKTKKISEKLLPNAQVQFLTELQSGDALVCTNENDFFLLKNNGENWKSKSLLNSTLSKNIQINQIAYFENRLYAATSNGLYQIEIDKQQLRATPIKEINESIDWPHFQYIMPLTNSKVLFQTFYTAMYLYSFENGYFKLEKEIARSPFKTNGTVDIGGAIYFATTSGIWKYDSQNNTLEQYALSPFYCTAIAKDADNFLWITTTNGILKFDIQTKNFHRFTEDDGLQHSTFNPEVISTDSQGKIIAGGINGLNIFNPKSINNTDQQYEVLLNEIFVNEKKYTAVGNALIAKKLFLTHYQNTLAFNLSPLSFTNAKEQPVHYKMQGFEKDFVTVKGQQIVRYPKLPPGEYTFIAYGSDSARPLLLAIKIQPPFWKTWWFLALVLLLIIGTIIFIFKRRIAVVRQKQLQRVQLMLQSQEEERKRIARDLHDDFGARLSTLKMYMATLDKNESDNPQEISKYASEMVDTTIAELRNILLNLSPKTLDENGLKSALSDLAYNINKLLPLQFIIDAKSFKSRLEKSAEFSLYRICQELTNNTIKHSRANTIHLSLVEHDTELVILYEDNGIGFDTETVKKGYGWNNIKMHAKAINSELIIDSAPGKGVAVTITFPLNNKSKTK